jgi:mono/diheme cytochrome c family protein
MMCRGSAINGDRPQAHQSRRVAERSLLGFAALVVTLLSGCDAPGKPNSADRPVPPEKVLEFATLYKTNCAGCHGADGEYGPAPPLNDSLFRSLVPAKDLERVVSAGRPGTPMPAFALANGGTLTAAQIRVLVYEIKGIPYKLADVPEGKEIERQPVRDAAGIAPQWGFPKTVAANTPSYLSPHPLRFERAPIVSGSAKRSSRGLVPDVMGSSAKEGRPAPSTILHFSLLRATRRCGA